METALQDKPEREMSTEEVGAFVMNELRTLDKVAYVRFRPSTGISATSVSS